MTITKLPQDDLEAVRAVSEREDHASSSDAESFASRRTGTCASLAQRGRRLSLPVAVGCLVALAFSAGHLEGRHSARKGQELDGSAIQGKSSANHPFHKYKKAHGHKKPEPTPAPTPAPSAFTEFRPTDEQLTAARAAAEAKTREELTEPEVLRSPVHLKFEALKLPTPWIGGYFWTRGYSGSIPGPTIRVKPGETLEITLENTLGPGPGYKACNFDHADAGFFMNPNLICDLNSTNLHTHGLHVSPEEPGDSIFPYIGPGETMKSTIQIPENHMGGTHWYHPHHHHATSGQAGGGAHGALIVDDPVGYLPSVVQDMPEKMMFLSLVNIPKAMRMEAWGMEKVGKQVLWRNSEHPKWVWDAVDGTVDEHLGGIEPQLVVNGQFQPKLTMEDGKWYRFRIAFAAVEQKVEIFQAGHVHHDAHCEYQLLAKDGIYLHEAPRAVDRIHLVSGSRADLAVQCTCKYVGAPCHTHLKFTALWQPMGLGSQAMSMSKTTSDLMRLDVVGGEAADSAANTWESWLAQRTMHPTALTKIPSFEVRRPCYLADTRNAWVSPQNKHKLEMPMLYPMQVVFDGKGKVWGHETPEPWGYLPIGQIQEWRLKGIRYHPFHLHVNPYQIVQMWNDPYYLPGDWHDTVLGAETDDATIRFHVDRFTGKMIGHCHILEHEDNGMMAYWEITGTEGTTNPYAPLIDAQCYNSFYPGPLPMAPPPAFR